MNCRSCRPKDICDSFDRGCICLYSAIIQTLFFTRRSEVGNYGDNFSRKLIIMDANWPDMPADILDEIAVKLIAFDDLLAFSIACHSWYSAYTRAKHRWSPRMPWLMLAENTKDKSSHLRKFFDPCSNKCYKLKVPETFTCWGSAYGWIIALDLGHQIFMFNPLTGARLELPSGRTLPLPLRPEWIDYSDPVDNELCCRSVLDRVILIKIPQKGGQGEEFVAVSIGEARLYVGIAKPNDSRWTPIIREDSQNIKRIMDVTYWNDGLLLLQSEGGIYRVELDYGAATMNNKEGSLIAKYYSPPTSVVLRNSVYDRMYFTESSRGNDLLAVWRFIFFVNPNKYSPAKIRDPVYKTHVFYAFKFNDESRAWEPLKNLEDSSIFVGSNSTMAIQARETNGCRYNCIYFTDDVCTYWSYPKQFGRHDMGIYSIDNNSGKNHRSAIIEPLYHGEDSRARFCCPLWFFPKFFLH